MKFNFPTSAAKTARLLAGLLLALTAIPRAQLNAAGQVVAGNKSAFHISDTGELFGWGANASGQLGDGTQIDRPNPVLSAEESAGGQPLGPWVTVATNLTGISGADFEGHALAIDSNGQLWAWGDNSLGQLGQGDTQAKLLPVRVGDASNWVDVAVGSAYSVALNDQGELWLWGDNRFGQLGPEVTGDFLAVPTQLPDKDGTTLNNDTWIKIAAGAEHVLAIHGNSAAATSGQLYAWGRNTVGQLGLGEAQSSSHLNTPTQVGTSLWKEVEAGITSSFAISASSGVLYAWGEGGFGSLGLGASFGTSIQQVSSPQSVVLSAGTNNGFVGVSAGSSHTLAWRSSGQLYVVGQNASGQLGINATTPQLYNVFQFLSNIPGFSISNPVVQASAGRAFSVILLADGSVLTTGSNERGQLGNGTFDSLRGFAETSLGSVDLTLEAISITTSRNGLAATDVLNFQVLLRNNGTGTVSNAELAGIIFSAVLSPSTVPGAAGQVALDDFQLAVDAYPDFALPGAAELGPSSAITVRFTARIPDPIFVGDYNLLMAVDTSNVIEESNELNNRAFTDEASKLLFRADLTVEILSPTSQPAPYDAADPLLVQLEFTNQGTGSLRAGNSFDFRLFLAEFEDAFVGEIYELSPDANFEFRFENELLAGAASGPLPVEVLIPETVNLGLDYFLGASVDSTDSIPESDETNNLFFSATNFVEVLGVDLFTALDRPSANDPELILDGAANWFGKGDLDGAAADAADADYSDAGDAAQSPPLQPGEQAVMTFVYPEPREIRFRWRAETSSPQNRLFFGENGNPLQPEDRSLDSDLSGNIDWQEVGYIIPKDQPVGFYYQQGVAAAGDVVYVDQMSVSAPITLPDYVISEIEYRVDEYVLERDRLTVVVQGQNRGALGPLPEGFRVKVWLSRDADGGDSNDVLLGDLRNFQILDSGARFTYQASFDLPAGLEDADYYVLARVDAGNGIAGDPDETGVVDEYTFGGGPEPTAFSPEDNNWRVSDTAGVRIRRLPDLWVTNLAGNLDFPIDFDTVDTEPLFVAGPTDADGYSPTAGLAEERIFAVFIKEPLVNAEGELISGELALRFDLVNRGLGDLTGQNVSYSVYLAPDRESALDPANRIISSAESSGFASFSGRTYELTTDIPASVEAGRFYYVAVVVDEANQVAESDEGNNSSYTQDRDVFIGEVPLEVALNDDATQANIGVRAWDEGYLSSFATGAAPQSPWFGQKTTFNNDTTSVRAAAQSGPVGLGETSYMTTDIINDATVEFPLYVSFRWKIEAGVDDVLQFEVRDLDGLSDQETSVPYRSVTSADPDFSGNVADLTEITDWRKASFIIEQPGDYRLRWSYTESGDLTPGKAWVDSFSLESPDLLVVPGSVVFDNIVDPGSDGLDAGDSFDLDFTLRNNGDATVRRALVQIRLLKNQSEAENLDWSVANFEDVVLVSQFEADLASGEFVYSAGGRDTTIVLPAGMTDDGDYFVAVWVDYLDTVPERNESNNLAYSADFLTIQPQLTIAEALEFDPDSLIDATDPSNGWFLTGDGRWFPLDLAAGTPIEASPDEPFGDALQAPALQVNEQAGFEVVVEGPKLLTFWWRADSPGSDLTSQPNTLRFQINGQNVRRELDANGQPLPIDSADFGTSIALTGSLLDGSGSSDSGWVKEAVFIPAGAQVLAWNYSRDDASAAGSFWVDQINLIDVNEPELAISSVDYTAGTYGLERDTFPLQVKVTNRGATPAGFNYDNLQLEVSLSPNRNPGQNDLPIGILPLTELLSGGEQMIFSGELDLPVNIAAGEYYLLVQVRALDPAFQEYANLLNNNFFVSNAFDIEIVALPRLDTNLLGFAQDKVYYPQESLNLNWELLNIGLGDVPAGSQYTQRIELWSFNANDTEFLISNASFVRELTSVAATDFLPGALSRDDEEQSVIEYQTLLRMPRATDLLADLDVIDEGLEDEDAAVAENLSELDNYLFFFVIVRDTELPQSSNLSIRYFPGQRFVIRAVPQSQRLGDEIGSFLSYDTWRDLNQSVFAPAQESSGIGISPQLPNEDPASIGASGVPNLLHYALNLPLESAPGLSPGAGNTFTRTGTHLEQDGDANQKSYRSLTFPVVRGAIDLNYIIEVSDDGGLNWQPEPLVEIQPPYLDNRGLFRAGYLGSQSLTSPTQANSLVNTPLNPDYAGAGDITIQPVLSVIDQNYTALVTVRDIVNLNDLAVPEDRTLRLRVEENERILGAELELTEPGVGTVGDAAYVKGAYGFELVPPAGPLAPGDTLEVNFDVWSIGEIEPASARVQIRLVATNSGSVNTLDWSTAGFEDLVLFDGILPLDQTLDSSEYLAFRRNDLVIPENVLAAQSYYVAVWVDYLGEISEFDETNNLAFSAAASVDLVNPLTLAAAIESDLINIDIDGDPLTVDVVTWTQAGDAPWFPVFDASPNSGSAPDGAFEDEALSSPQLSNGQTAKLRTNLGDVPRVIEFDWYSRTSSPDSFLSVVTVASGEPLFTASGLSTAWQTASVIIPAGAEVEFRYTQGTPNADDRVFIDNLVVSGELTSPDFVLTGIDLTDVEGAGIDAGSYVLETDPLYVNVSAFNQGTDSPGDFSIELYLSRDTSLDAGDVLIRDYFEDQGEQFLSGNGAVNGFAINLPNTLAAGNYYLIAVINRNELDINEDGRTANNLLVTETPNVEIVRLPDLRIANFSAQPGYYLVDDNSNLRNFLDFEFVVENRGLADVDGPFTIRVLLSPDNTLDPAADYIVLEYTFNGSLAQGASQMIQPDSVELRQNIPLGAYQFMGAYIDAGDVVLESNESNNGRVLLDNDFVFSLRTLREGLDLDPAGPEVILNDENAPYASDNQPWVVQSAQSVDGEDALTNVRIGDDESSSFSVVLNPASDVRVSFWWKVSSQNELVEGINQRDLLSFSVDGAEAVAPIFGTDDPDWRRVEVPLSAGPHTLTWTYTKDDQGSQGEDRGWVDRLVITEQPNLQVSGLSVDEAPVYAPDGDTIDTWSVTVTNTGASAIAVGTAFDVAVRLLPTPDWADASARTLLTITDTDGLAVGASRTYTQASHGALALPAGDYSDEFYYYAAYADWLPGDPLSGRIAESFEDDNLRISGSAALQVGLPDVVTAGVGGVAGPYSYNDAYSLDLTLDNIGEGLLLAGSSFDARVFLVPVLAPGVENSPRAHELGTLSVGGTGVAAGDSLPVQTLNGDLRYGIANGSYYIGVQLDPADALVEQGGLSLVNGDARNRADGEGNNLFFSSNAVFTVNNGISLAEALDQPALTITTSGDGTWFSRDDAGDVGTAADDQSFVDADGLQSPSGLADGQSASFTFVSAASQLVRFDWSISGTSASNVLSVSVNGIERAAIDNTTGETGVEVLVSSGSTVKWTYTVGDAAAAGPAYVDNIELVANNLPDLAITEVNYLAGEYVLDREQAGSLLVDGEPQYLQTRFLDVSVTAENQGEDLPATLGTFTSADIEVRLSLDSEYGNPDDVILGNFAQVEGDFNEDNLLSFLGPIALGDHIPAGFYYLMVRIDPNDRVNNEFTQQNNFWRSSQPDVQITRLPDLRIENVAARFEASLLSEVLNFADIIDVDETGIYLTNGRMRIRFNILNRGLAALDGSEEFVTQVNLRGIRRPEFVGDPLAIETVPDLFSAATDPIILGELVIQDELLGRTATSDGDIKPVDVELFLPDAVFFLDVIEEDATIADYLWFVEVIVDSEEQIAESNSFNTWWGVDVPQLLDSNLPTPDWVNQVNGETDDGLFGINVLFPGNEAAWEVAFGVTADENGTPAEVANFLAYAFNRNPADGDTAGAQFPGSFGMTAVAGEEYLSITFDFPTRVNDLQYVIQADEDVNFLSPDVLLTLTPPYNASTGSAALTGPGGLVEAANVTSLMDLGGAARITVRDTADVATSPTRFIRIVVDSVDTTAVP